MALYTCRYGSANAQVSIIQELPGGRRIRGLQNDTQFERIFFFFFFYHHENKSKVMHAPLRSTNGVCNPIGEP